MPQVLIDSGPLIALAKLNRLEVLHKLWGTVQMTSEVWQEAVEVGQARGAPDALTIFLFWQQYRFPVVSVSAEVQARYRPALQIDPGEHSTLAIAQTLSDGLVLLDDEDARSEARRLAIPVRGTLGVLVEGYRQQHLTLNETELLIKEIAARPDIWISSALCQQVLNVLRK
ncbi:MAG: hypothetical protein ACT4QE_16700 [Anaerolineales bacterium]